MTAVFVVSPDLEMGFGMNLNMDFGMDLIGDFIKPLDAVFQPVVMEEIEQDQDYQQDGHYPE